MLENKTLLELANETDSTKFKEGFEKLTQEEQKAVSTHLAEEATKAKAERDAATAEKRRQEELAAKAKAEAEKGGTGNGGGEVKTFEQKLREENIAAAKVRVFSEMGITKDEDKLAIGEMFQKLDGGSVTVDNIMADIRKAVLAAKPDDYLDATKRIKEMEQGADEFNRSQAGNAGGNTVERQDGKTYSKEAENMVRDSARRGQKLTLEEAENYLQKGATRIIR